VARVQCQHVLWEQDCGAPGNSTALYMVLELRCDLATMHAWSWLLVQAMCCCAPGLLDASRTLKQQVVCLHAAHYAHN
jgi:hypothetical protein